MKVQCEVCAAEAAEVYCCADEAALCGSCDRRVHHANRLAGKHHRYSLIQPSSSPTNPPPLCDVCKEKRGFVFCQEDRAILCRDCDVPIHSTTALTTKHTRFLLTGVRLSATPMPPSLAAAETEAANSLNRSSGSGSGSTATSAATATDSSSIGSTSSISEYLIKTLPGWHVEDLLTDDATAHAHAYCKTEEGMDLFYGINGSDSFMNGMEGGVPIRVPQAQDWVSAGQGMGHEEVEMKAGGRTKRPRVSARYL